MLLHHFLFSSVKQLFLQGMSIVLARRFLTVDRETVGEIFRIHTKKNSRHEKTAKTQSFNRFFDKSRKRDSNTRLTDYESVTLPTELFRHNF